MENTNELIINNYHKLTSTTGFIEAVGADGIADIKKSVTRFTSDELLESYSINDYIKEYLKEMVREYLDESITAASAFMEVLYNLFRDY